MNIDPDRFVFEVQLNPSFCCNDINGNAEPVLQIPVKGAKRDAKQFDFDTDSIVGGVHVTGKLPLVS